MFSDSVHSSYMEIYNGIRDYSEYCSVQKERTILAMLNLYIIMYAFTKKDSTYKCTDDVYSKLEKTVREDYDRAINNEPYC